LLERDGVELADEHRRPGLNVEAQLLVNIFMQCHHFRASNGFAPQALNLQTWQEWEYRYREKLNPFVLEMLYRMDEIYLLAFHDAKHKQT
jgi:hypothetical protein